MGICNRSDCRPLACLTSSPADDPGHRVARSEPGHGVQPRQDLRGNAFRRRTVMAEQAIAAIAVAGQPRMILLCDRRAGQGSQQGEYHRQGRWHSLRTYHLIFLNVGQMSNIPIRWLGQLVQTRATVLAPMPVDGPSTPLPDHPAAALARACRGCGASRRSAAHAGPERTRGSGGIAARRRQCAPARSVSGGAGSLRAEDGRMARAGRRLSFRSI
ncbi:MAG: hypothetical protein JWR77_1831 [Rhizorhabdus sp.]|nr:hypothetical protein [Rhizorhabdus sp.]